MFDAASGSTLALMQVGTSDVRNFGDLLYPILLQGLLARRGARATLRRLSPLGGRPPLRGCLSSRPLRTLYAEGAAPARVVVGGGDLLRVDWDVLAGHYREDVLHEDGSLRRALGLTGALRHRLLRPRDEDTARADFLARFKARALGYPAPAPFVLDPSELPAGSTVSYVSVGVPHEIGGPERAAVAAALDRARFVWVRDDLSSERLRRAGVTAPLQVAPDLATALSDLFDRGESARRGRAVLQDLGVDVAKEVVCFQSMPALEEAEIAAQLRRHQEATGAEVVLLPLGACHGDREFARRLARRGEGRFHVAAVRAPADVVAVIAAASRFAGTSLHGTLTAFAFGIPHVVGPPAALKVFAFLDVVGAPREHGLRAWSDLDEGLRWAGGLSAAPLLERAAQAKSRAHAALDALLAAVFDDR